MNSKSAIWFGGVIISLLVVATFAWAANDGEEITFEQICAEAIKKASQSGNSPEAQEALRAMVQFGLDVHGDVLKSTPNKTVVTSPFSIMSMLGMLRNAASGDTATQMQLSLGNFRGSLSAFNTGMEELSGKLRTVKTGLMLTFGNMSIVDKQRALINPKFKAAVKKHFGAAAEAWDFSNTDKLIEDINKYIANNTNQMIPKLLGNDDAPEIWALINAGYYKADWAIEFNVKATVEKYLFKLGDGSTKEVPLMHHRDATLPYYETPDFQIASIPYRNADFTMDVIVPKIKSGETPGKALERVSGQLSEKNYSTWVKSLKRQKLDVVAIPRWETGSELKEVFKAVLVKRMPEVFQGDANFSAMLESGSAPKLGTVIHATVIKTNELGSEGAFVTYGGGLESAFVAENPSIRADHPFIAVIRHVSTGIPVFVITEWDPKPMAPPDAVAETTSTSSVPSAGPAGIVEVARQAAGQRQTAGQVMLAKQKAAADAMNSYLGRIEGIDELLAKAYGSTVTRAAIVGSTSDKRQQIVLILAYLRKERLGDPFVQALRDDSAPSNLLLEVAMYFGS